MEWERDNLTVRRNASSTSSYGSSTHQQDHLEIFLSKAGAVEAASTVLNKDYHVVKEAAFFWDASW